MSCQDGAVSTQRHVKVAPPEEDTALRRRRLNEASCQNGVAPKNNIESGRHRAKAAPCQKRSRANTASCQYDNVSKLRRIKTVFCQKRCRVKTMSWQHGVVSRRRYVNTVSCQNTVESTRHRVKTVSSQNGVAPEMVSCKHEAVPIVALCQVDVMS